MTSTPTSAIAGGSLRPAVVVGGNRIPFARAHGAYAGASNQDMLTSTLEGLVARFGLQNEQLGEVVAGAVMKHSTDFNLTRESVLGTSLKAHTPAHDVQTACATGIETDRKSTRLNSSHVAISYAVFCLKKKRQRAEGPPPPRQRVSGARRQ